MIYHDTVSMRKLWGSGLSLHHGHDRPRDLLGAHPADADAGQALHDVRRPGRHPAPHHVPRERIEKYGGRFDSALEDRGELDDTLFIYIAGDVEQVIVKLKCPLGPRAPTATGSARRPSSNDVRLALLAP